MYILSAKGTLDHHGLECCRPYHHSFHYIHLLLPSSSSLPSLLPYLPCHHPSNHCHHSSRRHRSNHCHCHPSYHSCLHHCQYHSCLHHCQYHSCLHHCQRSCALWIGESWPLWGSQLLIIAFKLTSCRIATFELYSYHISDALSNLIFQ